MQDVRRAKRVYSLLKAKIIFDGGMPPVECIINDISNSGAKIMVANALALPDVFDLAIPIKGRTFRAEVRWRDQGAVGLAFVEAIESDQPPEDPADSLKANIRRLEAVVRILSQRLGDLGEDVPALLRQV